jgi:DNA primase small subunit
MGEEAIARLLTDAFRRYYRSHEVAPPPALEKREFGVGAYGRKIVKRHMSFVSPREFRNYLRNNAPHYISYSVGYFEYPDAPFLKSENSSKTGSRSNLERFSGRFFSSYDFIPVLAFM